MNIRSIRKQLVRFNESALPESFVALIVTLNPRKIPLHAGILIRLNGVDNYHHFGRRPQVVENFTLQDKLIYKILNFIKVDDESEIQFFLDHCRRVCDNSKITYSCVADGSHYDSNGEFHSASGLPELGTCVSFCLNTLALYFIDEPYLQLEEWGEESVEGFGLDNYGLEQTFKEYPLLDRGLYNAYHRRITPTEYLCSAFFNSYPIHREQIEDIATDVLDVIDEKF